MTATPLPAPAKIKTALALAAALLFLVNILMTLLVDTRDLDFSTFYVSGVIVHEGHGGSLYDLAEQARVQRQVSQLTELRNYPRPPMPYVYPPFLALLLAPLAGISYVHAYVLWGALNVVAWLFSAYLLWRQSPISGNFYRYSLLLFLFLPVWGVLRMGQATLILLLLLTAAFVSLERGADFWSGVFLGLGLFKFAVVVPLALICLARGKWRQWVGLVCALAFLVALSLVAVGPGGIRAYVSLMIDILKHPGNPAYISLRDWPEMPTLKGLITTLLARHLPLAAITRLSAAASVPLIVFAAWRWRQVQRVRHGTSPRLMFAAALTLSLVTAPHLYPYDLALMLLAAHLVLASPDWCGRSYQRYILIAAMVILYTPPVYLLLARWHSMYLLAPVLLAFALAAISLAYSGGRQPEGSIK